MKRLNQMGIALALIGVLLPATDSGAHPQASNLSRCPPGYDHFGTICLSPVTGDVVNAVRSAGEAAQNRSDTEVARDCASHDLSAWSLIEQHGEVASLRPQLVGEAFFEVMDARRACLAGRSEAALAIYARVIARLKAGLP